MSSAVPRIALSAAAAPHFVGAWNIDDGSLCADLIAFFESNARRHLAGAVGDGHVDRTVKASTDLTIAPADLKREDHKPVAAYVAALHECFRDYAMQWPFLHTFLERVHIGSFNLQKYAPGEHFADVHSERTSMTHLHRVLAWMTYLNDVEAGGETEFTHYGLRVRPERGKTLIWPAEWTHAHCGHVVAAGTKYIVTGWMHFPDD